MTCHQRNKCVVLNRKPNNLFLSFSENAIFVRIISKFFQIYLILWSTTCNYFVFKVEERLRIFEKSISFISNKDYSKQESHDKVINGQLEMRQLILFLAAVIRSGVFSLPESWRISAGRNAIVKNAAVAIYRRDSVDLTIQRLVAVASDRVAFCKVKQIYFNKQLAQYLGV